jgi:hypothetical protein
MSPLPESLADPRRLCVRRVSPVGKSAASRSRVRVGRVVLTTTHQRYECDSVGVDYYECCRRRVGKLGTFWNFELIGLFLVSVENMDAGQGRS